MKKIILSSVASLVFLNMATIYAVNVTATNDSPSKATITIGKAAPVSIAPAEVKYLSVDYNYPNPIVFQSYGSGQTSINCEFPVLQGKQNLKISGILLSITEDPQSKRTTCTAGWQ